MFQTKIDVDRHVENALKKVNNENERILRYFAFAKLYYRVGEYELTRRYVSTYLTIKPHSAEGQHLLGNALEKLGKKDAALQAYRASLDIDPKQNTLVLKVCELLASDEITLELNGANYWCEQAQAIAPHDPIVFSLRERIVASKSNNPNDVQKLLLAELEARPTDVNLRIRLLRHLLQNNQVQNAYKHVSDVERKHLSIFANNFNWYETVSDVLIRYKRDNSHNETLNWEFWILLVTVLDKLATCILDENGSNIKNWSECLGTVFNLDQTLYLASQNIHKCPEGQLIQEFLQHYRAQLCFHLSVLIFKQAKKELIKYKDATTFSLPLLLASYHSSPPDLQAIWLNHSTEDRRQQIQHWHREAAFRCSQTGHLLLSSVKEKKNSFLERVTQMCSGMWREQLFKRIFVTRDQQGKIKTSYFVSCPELIEITIRLPEVNDRSELYTYDETAQLMYPSSLHHYIWIALNNKLPKFKCSIFDGLQYSVRNLGNCSAETLNKLDILSFIFCATLCAQSNIEESRNQVYFNHDKPNILPVSVTETLGTHQQAKWLNAVYKVYGNDCGTDVTDLRLTIIRGIEIIRCVGPHGLDVKLLVLLAKTFVDRVKYLTKQSEIEFNEARAELYWRTALPLLERMKNNLAISYNNFRMFEYKGKEFSMSEISSNIEDGKLFSAMQLMKKKEHEKANKIFETLKNPYASFYQGQIYKQLADEQMNQNKESVTSEMRSQNIILLSRARDCFYLTLDRLREPSMDRKHPLNAELGTEIEKIERLLSRIDPDVSNRNECDGMSDENLSSNGSIGDHVNLVSNYLPHGSYINGNMTPSRNFQTTMQSTPYRNSEFPMNISLTRRTEARPSPERLDAQLRQMAATKDAAISFLLDSHRTLLEEHRTFKDNVAHLQSTVDELVKQLKEVVSVDIKGVQGFVLELKDYMQTIKDTFSEMKKEVQDLKKDSHKLKNISDEDLYVLDDDYVGDYNAGNPALYQGFLPRMQPSANIPPFAPPALYPGLGYPMYPYGGLGLGQPGLAFPEGQISDFRAMGLTQPSLLPGQPLPQPAMPNLFPKSPAELAGAYSRHDVQIPTTLLPIQTPVNPPVTQHVQPPNPANMVMPPSSRAAPINVVITSSDPLPTTSVTPPPMSVTIPPQHLKGGLPPKSQPHNYQIPLPSTTFSTFTTTSAIFSQPLLPITTANLLPNVAPPLISAIPTSRTSQASQVLGQGIEKPLSQSFNASASLNDSNVDLNKSNTSNVSLEEHDPCPDFKPIIPLPEEIAVNTGEEGEEVLFCERAKLFRYDNKEWKERGTGNLKLLHNKDTGKVRLLMRRDQVFKICANHNLSKDMTLSNMPNTDKAYMWAANDFSDEEFKLEKLCVRFKSAEEAQKFYIAFEKAKGMIVDSANTSLVESDQTAPSTIVNTIITPQKPVATPTKTSEPSGVAKLGGFVFTTPPTFKPKDTDKIVEIAQTPQPPKPNIFAGFSFESKPSDSKFTFRNTEFKPVDKSLQSSPLVQANATMSPKSPQKTADAGEGSAEDFVPTAEFKPVIPLPSLVDVSTGEEGCEVLFENRAKLLVFDGTSKEWKERGLGDMKILKDKDVIRLVMRRDQVLKVCCNHILLKNMEFKKLPKTNKALSWYAQDYSDNVVKGELFAIRFRSQATCETFSEAIADAQAQLNDNNKIVDHISSSSSESDVKEASPKKQQFSFDGGAKNQATSTPSTFGFGDKFKPKSGSWECKTCYIQNEGKNNHCEACDTPKNDTIPKKASSDSGKQFSFGVPSPNTNFSFGYPPASQTTVAPQSTTSGFTFESKSPPAATVAAVSSTTSTSTPQGFGDAFKPKAGSWECKTCYIVNAEDAVHCLVCESPKDDTVLQKEKKESSLKGINLDTPGQSFSFGIPAATAAPPVSTTPRSNFLFGESQNKISTGFTFGSAKVLQPGEKAALDLSATKPDFSLNKTGSEFIFGSPMKHDFEFKPRSPRKSSGAADDESEGSFVEDEGEHLHFTPVIPLPDKIEVKTGEEQEEVLYCHRAKLFRFVDGEWKERGIGDVKILKNIESNKLRVVMRREQVLKICLNHALTKEIEYIPKDEKSLLFSAADFSEGEIVRQQFAIRFKNGEIAQEFKKVVDEAVKNIPVSSDITQSKDQTTDSSDSDVEIVSELKVTPEQEKQALELQLPRYFYTYLQKPPCPGCIGCEPDDDDDNVKPILSKPTPSAAGGLLFGTDSNKKVQNTSFSFLPAGSLTDNSGGSIFGTPKSQDTNTSVSSVFGTPPIKTAEIKQPQSETLKSLIQKPSLFSQSSFGDSPGSSIFGTPTGKPIIGDAGGAKPTNIFGGSGALFGSGATPIFKTNTFGGGNTGELVKTEPQTSIFGTKTNLFSGGSSLLSQKTDGSIATPPTTSSLFSFVTPTTGTSNIFSTPPSSSTPASAGTGGFSFATSKPTSSTTSIFSNPPMSTPTGGSIFGSEGSANKSIFGGPVVFEQKSTIFGGAAAAAGGGDAEKKLSENKSIEIAALFGEKTSTTPLSFGTLAKKAESTPVAVNKVDDIVLKCDSSLSFASLAAGTGATPVFAPADQTKSFAFEGAGALVFGSKSTPKSNQKNKEKLKTKDDGGEEEGDDEEEPAVDGEYDPHYEPIVPLPEAIVVTTGEEDETMKFNERAKLFRWDDDTKEWKERGVGQMKILHNPTTGTYRFLLRREQVHKVVLNQLITTNLELQPLNTSDKAWLWVGYNHTDDGSSLEKLAIRFKNTELAQQFYGVVQQSIESIHQYQLQNASNTEPEHDHDQDYEGVSTEEEEYDNDDDDDERSLMFTKRCSLSYKLEDGTWKELGMGEIQMFYDSFIYGARICMTTDAGEQVSSTVIGINTVMEVHGDKCEWRAVENMLEPPEFRTLRATFSSTLAAEEFHINYTEALSYAQQSDIVDEIHQEGDDDPY